MNKLTRKDIKMLEMLATTTESDDKLAEYIHHHKKAVKAYKAFREAVVNGVEVDKVEKVVEVKRKFKAGDKVRVTSVASDVATTGLSVGDITEVICYKEDDSKYAALDPNFRTVVVLDPLDASGQGFFEEYALELVVEEEQSPNELRAEIIERAKSFIESATERGKDAYAPKVNDGHEYYRNRFFNVDFHAKNNKVTALVYLTNYAGKIINRKPSLIGRAKCNPDDVFNEHIGKAIALGRAIGKDVSEFTNAVQPSELVVGMVIRRNYFNSTDTYEEEIEKIKGEVLHYAGGRYDLRISDADNLTIIDDTNARY